MKDFSDKKLPFKVWKYEEQTKIKHLVFEDYFDKWVKILGRHGKLNYIDGFAGCGAYKDEKGKIYPGSPILAAEIIERNKINLGRDVNLIIIDKDEKNLENIEKILKYKNINVNPIFINDDFDRAINKILNKTPRLLPTFFLVDPFGYKIKFTTLKRIINIKHSEILLNFMFNAINRWMGDPSKHQVITDLMGTPNWIHIPKLAKKEREDEIIRLFRKNLKDIAKFVFPYGLNFPEKQRTYYYLFHIANHHLAASIMKSCFAKYAKGRIKYLGIKGNQLTFWDLGGFKTQEIKNFLFDKYRGVKKKYVEIIKENIDETPYQEKEIKNSIKELEKENKIYIERFPKITIRKKQLKVSIEDLDIIYFNFFPSIERKSLLYKTKVEYGNFTINHVFGCAHGCNYPCYARMMAKRYGKIKDYDEWLYPKIVSNSLELLDKEIPKYKNEIDFVHLSFSTDPFMYDKLNKRTFPHIKELTLKIIAKLNRFNLKCTVLTKGIFPKELINTRKFGKHNEYGITLVSLDEKFKKVFEPYSPSFLERIKALKFLHNKGLKTWVSIEPYPTPNILPSPGKVGQDLNEILKKMSFVDKVIFGRMNYNVRSSLFEDNKDFYEEMAKKVISFCKKNKIKYHIKAGTQKKYDASTEKIFREN